MKLPARQMPCAALHVVRMGLLAAVVVLPLACQEYAPPRELPSFEEIMTKRVLIVCTGNSCRSQMAEVLWNELGRGRWQASSAGHRPAGYVHPLALRVLEEIGLDGSGGSSKHLDAFKDESFDLVVTVCDSAKESCPAFPGVKETLHWPFDDPASASGTEDEQLEVFRRVRDEIREQIAGYLAEN